MYNTKLIPSMMDVATELIWDHGLLIINFGDVVVELMLTRLLAAADVAVLAGGGGSPRRKAMTELCAMEVLPRFVMHAEERKGVRKRGRCYVVVERSSMPFVGSNGGFEF